eukprot:14459865-Alexandrium_andersonii.AAC.1
MRGGLGELGPWQSELSKRLRQCHFGHLQALSLSWQLRQRGASMFFFWAPLQGHSSAWSGASRGRRRRATTAQ